MKVCKCDKQGRKQLIDKEGKAWCAKCKGFIKQYEKDKVQFNKEDIRFVNSLYTAWHPLSWLSGSIHGVKV